MADDNRGLVAAGARLVWRRRGLLWWIFAVNFVLGAMGTLLMARELNRALKHSLAGEQLFRGFDLGMFYELVRLPEVKLLRFTTGSYGFAALFALFMLFVSGGILETYRQGRRRIATGDFFAASGAFFWRFVRLMLFSLVPFALLGNAYLGLETGFRLPRRQGGRRSSRLCHLAGWASSFLFCSRCLCGCGSTLPRCTPSPAMSAACSGALGGASPSRGGR